MSSIKRVLRRKVQREEMLKAWDTYTYLDRITTKNWKKDIHNDQFQLAIILTGSLIFGIVMFIVGLTGWKP